MNPPYIIEGQIIDTRRKSLGGVEITYNLSSSFTDNKDGKFSLEINEEIPTGSKIEVYKEDYEQKEINITKRNGKIKENLGIIFLKTSEEALNESLSEELPLSNEDIKDLISPELNFEQLQQKALNDTISKVKLTLIPFVMKLLINFGVTKASEAIKNKFQVPKTCPSPEVIQELIKKRNKLAKQLNILFQIINGTLIALGITEGILILAQSSQTTILATPTPTPPIVPKTESEINSQIKKYRAIIEGTSIILTILSRILKRVLDLLESLDFKIQSCAKDVDLIPITIELNEINQTNQTSPELNKVNGFTFDIETEPTTNNIKRKRAVAKNPQGVILLRGEYSFSSSDQILIDELAFYIKTNNLKAD